MAFIAIGSGMRGMYTGRRRMAERVSRGCSGFTRKCGRKNGCEQEHLPAVSYCISLNWNLRKLRNAEHRGDSERDNVVDILVHFNRCSAPQIVKCTSVFRSRRNSANMSSACFPPSSLKIHLRPLDGAHGHTT